jgi:ligand-binding SRPBCC domain-containing protein
VEHFRRQSEIFAPAELVFAWHERPDAFVKLIPPGERVRVVERSGSGITPGTRITIEMGVGLFKQKWVALHTDYQPGRMFRDQQVEGPFRAWTHTHRVEPRGPDRSLLIDEVQYELPFGTLGRIVAAWWVRRKLQRMFEYRHQVTKEACEREASQV